MNKFKFTWEWIKLRILEIPPQIRIAVIYVIVAAIWILTSDWVLYELAPDLYSLSRFQTAKGLFYVLFTSALLYFLIKRDITALQSSYDVALEGWVQALDMRDNEIEGHTLRVTEITIELASRMGIRGEELNAVRRGALLHDIGKIGVPDEILHKPGPLTDEEWKVMRQHPVDAYKFIAPAEHLRPAIDIPYCHHEKWDGTGYPRRLQGEKIPLPARIFAVVDVWDALTSDRPYRSAWSEEKALDHIRSLSGSHFDPEVVSEFLKMMAER